MARDIDIRLIRTFLTVAESGGMTSAATSLNLTQGAVSQKIKRLEALFGAELFERKQKKPRLTPDGERLMARAYRMISLNDDTRHLMTQPAFTGGPAGEHLLSPHYRCIEVAPISVSTQSIYLIVPPQALVFHHDRTTPT